MVELLGVSVVSVPLGCGCAGYTSLGEDMGGLHGGLLMEVCSGSVLGGVCGLIRMVELFERVVLSVNPELGHGGVHPLFGVSLLEVGSLILRLVEVLVEMVLSVDSELDH